MTIIRIEQVKPWYAPWRASKLKATWANGNRTFVHGIYLTSSRYFDSFTELFKWAEENCWHLDSFPAGGGYCQISLRICDLQIKDIMQATGMTDTQIAERQKKLVPKTGLVNEHGWVE